MDPVMRDLNRHLSALDALEARDLAAEQLLEDEGWVEEEIGDFALNIEWEWVAALCRAVHRGDDCAAMLEGLRVDIERYLYEEARG